MTKETVAQIEELTPEQLADKKLAAEKEQLEYANKEKAFYEALPEIKKEVVYRTHKLWFELKLLEANLAQIHHQSGVPFIFAVNQGLIPKGINFIMRPQPTAEQVAQAKAQAEAQAQPKQTVNELSKLAESYPAEDAVLEEVK